MKTIAISIDEGTLEAIDQLVEGRRSRSEVVREALREYLVHRAQRIREEHDRRVVAANREELARSAAALVREQAKP
jgi:metal-responsive CopG/Arc/MetJ family transcriptional regulator